VATQAARATTVRTRNMAFSPGPGRHQASHVPITNSFL
jgi:hypothetical protein